MRIVQYEELPKVKAVPLFHEKTELRGYQAIINPDTCHVFDIPTEAYQLMPHQEVLDRIETKLSQCSNTLGKYEREIRIDGEGERMRTKYTFFNAPIEFKAHNKNEYFNPTVETINSYDRSWKSQIMIGAMRLVCTNGMMIGEKWGTYKKRHVRSLTLEDIDEVLLEGFKKVDNTAIEWKNWENLPVTQQFIENTIEKIDLNKGEEELLREEQEVSTGISIEDWLLFKELEMRKEEVEKMNMWVLFNIFTQFTTHQINTELRRLQLQKRIAEVFYN